MPVARYATNSACEIAWHRWDRPVCVAACGIVPVAASYSAGIVAWRTFYRHYRGTTALRYSQVIGAKLLGVSVGDPFGNEKLPFWSCMHVLGANLLAISVASFCNGQPPLPLELRTYFWGQFFLGVNVTCFAIPSRFLCTTINIK